MTTPEKTERHSAAVAFAAQNIAIFPCLPNGKAPATPNGFHDATTDPAQIDAWWSEADYNIGVCPEDAGWCVVDCDMGVDPKTGRRKDGEATWQGLCLTYGEPPETCTIRTPGGGRHLYFKGSLPGTQGKLGLDIDTRGRGSYVLVPPSVIDGKQYAEIIDADPAPVPDWIVDLFAREERRPSPAIGDPVSREHLSMLLGYLDPDAPRETWRNVVAGIRATPIVDDEGEDWRRDLARKFSRGELDRRSQFKPSRYTGDGDVDQVFDTMPPKEDGVGYGTLYAEAEKAGYAGGPYRAPASGVFKDYIAGNLPADGAAPDGPIPFSEVLTRTPAPLRELVPGLIERGTVTFLSAPGGTHKSRLALQWGLCIAAGHHVFGRPVERATFVYLSYEDHADEVTRRAQALRRKLGLSTDIPAAHYWNLTATAPPLAVIGDEVVLAPFWQRFRDYLRSIEGPKFVVADSTYNVLQFLGAAKINETSVKLGIELLNRLCAETDTTLLALWHPSQSGQERGDASGWSVAWHNTPRARLSLSAVKDIESAFELKVEKRNNGPKGKPITLHWSDGALLPLSETATAEQRSLFQDACVGVAVLAAERDTPIRRRERLQGWQINEIELRSGRRPSERDVKEELARAVSLGKLRYQMGKSHQMAGYFPPVHGEGNHA